MHPIGGMRHSCDASANVVMNANPDSNNMRPIALVFRSLSYIEEAGNWRQGNMSWGERPVFVNGVIGTAKAVFHGPCPMSSYPLNCLNCLNYQRDFEPGPHLRGAWFASAQKMGPCHVMLKTAMRGKM